MGTYLYLFSVGLFPLMEKCGIKVKTNLLDLFEKFLVPLGPKLRPALPGFIAALFFALEEGSEFYGRAFDLLDRVMENSGPLSFYACLWQVSAVGILLLIHFVFRQFSEVQPFA